MERGAAEPLGDFGGPPADQGIVESVHDHQIRPEDPPGRERFGAVAGRHVPEIVSFLFAIPLLIPVSLPLLPPLYWYLFPWVHLTLPEMFVIGAVFWGTAFFMPAAFLQVSLTGRFLPAFRVARIVRFVLETPRAYVEAWALSLLATALAFLAGPLAPWGIFWSYLVIVHAFNDALIRWRAPEVAERFRRSALHVAAGAPGRRRARG